METNKIIHGNCLEKLKEIGANQVDLIYFDLLFSPKKNIHFQIGQTLKHMNLKINTHRLIHIYYLLKVR